MITKRNKSFFWSLPSRFHKTMQAKCHRVVFLIQIYGGEDTKPSYTSCPRDGKGWVWKRVWRAFEKKKKKSPYQKKKKKKKEKKKKRKEMGSRERKKRREKEKSNRNQILLLLKWQPRKELKGNGCVIKA